MLHMSYGKKLTYDFEEGDIVGKIKAFGGGKVKCIYILKKLQRMRGKCI